MSLFEFDSGHLVPAQFGRDTALRLDSEMLGAVREQVLELVGRPLFPVRWEESKSAHLLSMDTSGQVVTVEVFNLLDAAALVGALSRAGNSAALGWLDLAGIYPMGKDSFRRDWNKFRESLPPRTPTGPRVVIVANEISDEVRPALELLIGSGIEVYELALREFGDGRRFLEVIALRGPMAARSQLLLQGQNSRPAALMCTSEFAPVTVPEKDEESDRVIVGPVVDTESDSAESGTKKVVVKPAPIPRAPRLSNASLAVAAPLAAASVASTASQVVGAPAAAPSGPKDWREAAAQHVSGAAVDTRAVPSGANVPSDPGAALVALGRYLEEDTRLIWRQLRRGITHEATLRSTGELVVKSGRIFHDPSLAAGALSGRPDVDGWRVWRFGEAGPNLADALAELSDAEER